MCTNDTARLLQCKLVSLVINMVWGDRGITVTSVIAKLLAIVLEQRVASWAEEHAVKGKE